MDILAHPELLDRLAAAYALGTLRGGARRRFASIARRNPAARARVIVWQEHFAALAELQPAQQPSANAWKRIADAIAAEAPASAAAARARTQESPMLDRLRRRLLVWRGITAATTVAAVASLAMAMHMMDKPEIQYVAVLQDQAQNASMLVTFDPKKKTLTLKRVGGFQEAADRSLELWALPPGQAPKSLGVVQGQPVVRLTAGSRDVTTAPALAITLEPKGGAPGGKPTGPVLFKGPLLQTTL
ncbi:MAG TPA: anti-sigma factor [Ramlibacter sp.]